VLTSAII